MRRLFVLATIAIASWDYAAAQNAERTSIHEIESRRAALFPGIATAHAASRDTIAGSRIRSRETHSSSSALAKRVFGWVPYWISPSQWQNFDWSALTAIGYFSLEADTSGLARARFAVGRRPRSPHWRERTT